MNQIVTPDVMEAGQLSLAGQVQESNIGNPWQLQAELGLTPWAEVAFFQGMSPSEQHVAAEFGLLREQPFIVGAGFVGWGPHGDAAQPFLEAGWFTEHGKLAVGMLRSGQQDQLMVGYAYDFNAHWRVQADFQAGQGNSSTFGVTWSPDAESRLALNPAIYRSNAPGHALSAYFVASYNFTLWQKH